MQKTILVLRVWRLRSAAIIVQKTVLIPTNGIDAKNDFSFAGMAKLVDALDLGSSGATHKSSILFTRTKKL